MHKQITIKFAICWKQIRYSHAKNRTIMLIFLEKKKNLFAWIKKYNNYVDSF